MTRAPVANHLPPDEALALTLPEALARHERALGQALLGQVFEEDNVSDDDPSPASIPAGLRGPCRDYEDTSWLRTSNMIGINLRTVGGFAGAIKVALSFPAMLDSVHLLPVWEPGVAKSLYGICSWEINSEFFSAELHRLLPALHTPERQLKALVNLLHASGRAVGMDVIPHTDRYSEIVLCFPEYFEWLRRDTLQIVDHRSELHEEVWAVVRRFVAEHGPGVDGHAELKPEQLFADDTGEATRREQIFGSRDDKARREARRIALVKRLHALGYEPLPATMAPPYRGLEVDPAASTLDEHGLLWRDYRVTRPTPMSRAFGPLTRFKLYERLADNRYWEIDFSRPREQVWHYVCERYAAMQGRFGFDFMRGDMSHVQMRPGGPPAHPDARYDLLMAVKRTIQRRVPSFGYFAESFLAPRDVMGYGDEIDHLELCGADSTLGNLQSTPVGSAAMFARLRRYIDIAAERQVAPCLTVITADKDDPRFDGYYLTHNELRVFLGLFVTDMPSYVSLGFELRDPHPEPVANEFYSKLYVFAFAEGPKATCGPYRFGGNRALFVALSRIYGLAADILPQIQQAKTRWLLPPDVDSGTGVLCWTQREQPRLVFVANAAGCTIRNVAIPLVDQSAARLELAFSSVLEARPERRLPYNGRHHKLAELDPGECRVYRLASPPASAPTRRLR